MKRFAKCLLVFALLAVIAVPALAQDQEKKRKKKNDAGARNPAAALMRQLEKAELSDEQKEQVKKIGAQYSEKLAALAAKVNVSAEQRKAGAEARKKAQEDGVKGKALQEAVAKAMNLTDEQKEAQTQLQEVTGSLRQEIAAVLTDEQKEKAGIRARGKKKNKDG